MTHPLEVPGARICVLRHADEIVVCANPDGFRAMGEWMAWLGKSNPSEFFHFHLLLSLESEASRFGSAKPGNVWFLDTPKAHHPPASIPMEVKKVEFEITFQVLTEASLDELAEAQDTGLIPSKYMKTASSSEVQLR